VAERDTLEKKLQQDAERGDVYARYRLGLLLTVLEPEQALTNLMLASSLDPQFYPAVQTLRAALNLSATQPDASQQMLTIGRALGLVQEWDLSIAAFENAIKNEIEEYHKNRREGVLVKKAALRLDPQDAEYLLSLSQQTLPELIWKKGKYRAVLHGVEISFGPEDILRGQILIAGKAFSIDSKKPLSQIQGDLETFMLAQKIVENKRNENLFTRMLTSLLGVPSAEAAIPLLVVAVILLIGTIGVGFWLKSKEAQLRAVKEALRQAHRDITQKAEACERSNSESASYDTTFDLMASILAKKHENTAAGAFYSTMLQPTPEGTSPVQDCRTMVESFIERTFSRLAGTASEGSQLGELRTQL
ncbi:MAG: hypothetical protein AABY86_15480, partial [Bdellovibrionota bacterium]